MSFEREKGLPSFGNPPLHEVAIGIGFRALNCWDSIAPGEFRELVRDGFPLYEDRPPLPSLILDGTLEFELDMNEMPPVRRTWYLSEDSSTLIQLQKDRLHVNWRRTQLDSAYPRYGYVAEHFEFALQSLIQFAAERQEILEVTAGEVTYVNHIPEGQLWESWGDLTRLFRDWNLAPREGPSPVRVSTSISFGGGDKGCEFVSAGCNLNVEVKSGLRQHDNSKVLILTLVNRGKLSSNSFEDVRAWLGLASADIVKAFTSLTSASAHEAWGIKTER